MVKNKQKGRWQQYFFCICDECGSTDWSEVDEYSEEVTYNSLTKDGLQSEKRTTLFVDGLCDLQFGNFNCVDCENVITPIPFNEVSRKTRKEIYLMKPDERIEYAKSIIMLRNLEKPDETNKFKTRVVPS